MTTGSISNIPNLDLGYGAKLSQVAGEITEKAYKIRQLGKENLAESFLTEYSAAVNEFNSKVRYDKTYYENGNKYNELKNVLSDKYELFKKTAQDQEFTDIELEKISNKVKEFDLLAETSFGTKYTSYREEQEKQNFLTLQIKKTENQNTEMFQGRRETAIKGFKSSLKEMETAVNNNFIDEPKALEEAIKQKRNLINSSVLSNLDNQTELARLSNLSFEEFQKEYQDLNFKLKNNDMTISSDDYKVFKASIEAAHQEIKRRGKANELYTKKEALELEANLREKPVESALDTLQISAFEPISLSLDKVGTVATNYKYGTQYKSIKDVVNDGIQPITIQKGFNDKLSIYDNPQASSYEIMGARQQEYIEYVAGESQDIQESVFNGQYSGDTEAKVPIGYRISLSYFNYGPTKDLYDKVYTPGNRAALENYKNVELNAGANLEIYEARNYKETETYKNYVAGASPLQLNKIMTSEPPKGYYSELSLGGKLKALKLAGINDENSKTLSSDLEKFLKDLTIVMIEEKTGGILTKDLAKQSGIDESDIPISQLSNNQKQKVINYMTSTDEFQEELTRRFEPVFNEITQGIQSIDTGYGYFCNISSEFDGEKAAKGIRNIIETEKLTTKEGQIPSSKWIKPISYLNKNQMVLTFQGEVLRKDGKPYVIDLDDMGWSK